MALLNSPTNASQTIVCDAQSSGASSSTLLSRTTLDAKCNNDDTDQHKIEMILTLIGRNLPRPLIRDPNWSQPMATAEMDATEIAHIMESITSPELLKVSFAELVSAACGRTSDAATDLLRGNSEPQIGRRMEARASYGSVDDKPPTTVAKLITIANAGISLNTLDGSSDDDKGQQYSMEGGQFDAGTKDQFSGPTSLNTLDSFDPKLYTFVLLSKLKDCKGLPDMINSVVRKISKIVQPCPVLFLEELPDESWEIIILRSEASTLIGLLRDAFPNSNTKETDDPSEPADDPSNLVAVCREISSLERRTEGIRQYSSPEVVAVYAHCLGKQGRRLRNGLHRGLFPDFQFFDSDNLADSDDRRKRKRRKV